MDVKYTKDGHIISFETANEKARISIEIKGEMVVNPTIAMLIADGWQEYTPPTPPTPTPYLPTYSELVEQYIRENGYPTYGAELAVLNNYAEDKEQYADAYAQYVETRHYAKEWANEQPHREED